ncbi:MAG: hypothetical protein ABJI69_08230 [Balneola sp.]
MDFIEGLGAIWIIVCVAWGLVLFCLPFYVVGINTKSDKMLYILEKTLIKACPKCSTKNAFHETTCNKCDHIFE